MADPKTVVTLSVGKEGIDETKEMEMEGSLAVGEIARIRVEGLPESRLSLSDANAGLALRVVANIPRPAQVVPPWTDVYRHDRDPGLVAVVEPGGWTRAEDGALVATLNMATVQAYGLFAPPQPPPPPPPRMMPMRMPPPPPPRQAVPPFGGAGATMLLEFRSGDTAQSLLGSVAFTLLPWPPDAGTSDLIDLATGRVYSKAEVDALLSTKASNQALARVNATATDALSKSETAVENAQSALDGLAGKADLVGGKVPQEQLPSYVDDVLEFASRSAFPNPGEAGKIYVALDTNKIYRWSGSEYVQVGGGEIPVPVAPSTDPSAAGKPADAKATGDALAGKATVANATLTDVSVLTDWVFAGGLLEAARENLPAVPLPNHLEIYHPANADVLALVEDGEPPTEDGEFGDAIVSGNVAALSDAMYWVYSIVPKGGTVATRSNVSGYQLGSQSDKPLAPARDYALQSEIPAVPVKAVKRNGTALVPDAQGAVNVEVPTVVAPSTAAADAGKAADAKATGEALGAIAPDWVSGSNYSTYDCVKYNGEYYYAKDDITGSATAPSSDQTNWGSLAKLAAIVKLFLPKAGGRMFGNLSFDYTTAGKNAISFNETSDSTSIGSEGVKRADMQSGVNWPVKDGMFALLQDIADDFSGSTQYAKDALCVYSDTLFRCINQNGHTGSWSYSDFAEATVEDVLSALRTALAGKLDAAQRNLLDYTTGTTLAPQTAVYRASLNADGTFPTVDATAIPTASAYYCFELELTVPSTVPAAITGPSGWDWLDGGEPPDPSVLTGGETFYVACRLDCATRAVTANVWRVA